MYEGIKPAFDPTDQCHQFIWNVLAYELTEDDFEAIGSLLIERKKDHKKIDKSTVMFQKFDEGMYQPRPVPESVTEGAHRYVDWSCAEDIWMILSKYAKFYSKI